MSQCNNTLSITESQNFNLSLLSRRIFEESYKYEDVVPRNATTFTIGGLERNTDYVFSVMAINKIGQSKYRPDDTKVTTLSKFTIYFVFLIILVE